MTPVNLLFALAKEFEVGVEELRGPDRRHPLLQMRAISMATIRHHCGLSYPRLARLFHRLDHTTALHAVRHAANYREQYPELAAKAVKAAGVMHWDHEIANEKLEMCS